jgi:hypothetical protein
MGPTLLKWYQSGVFSTQNNNFPNHTAVQWVVFSYAFPNAGQYFQITPTVNNNFNVTVGVLPNTPPGVYTVQCRVSNSCGTYYIDRTFNVEQGVPQFFDFN